VWGFAPLLGVQASTVKELRESIYVLIFSCLLVNEVTRVNSVVFISKRVHFAKPGKGKIEVNYLCMPYMRHPSLAMLYKGDGIIFPRLIF
jgi:hypothetical protein